MKNYLIIGNPILHSLSPKIHNYWFKENNIDGNYDKIAPSKDEIEKIIQKIKRKEIYGINVTVPFKRSIISHLETQSDIAIKTNGDPEENAHTLAMKSIEGLMETLTQFLENDKK